MKPYFLLLITMLFTACASAEPAKRVLMILSGHGQQQGEQRPGYEFEEFAKAYLVFEQNGVNVDIATPTGGNVEPDEYNPGEPYNQKVLANNEIMHKLENSLPTSEVTASRYDGVFVVGGKGAMFDLPFDKALQQLIADIYEHNGAIAAVCHGPAALVNVKLNNGSYLVAGKAVNGFTNEEEALFGKKWAKEFSFMLEDKLTERGGKFQSSDIMLAHVVADNRLITGQNPTSTVPVAVELVKALGLTPVATEQYKGDKTLERVARMLNGDYNAVKDITSMPQDYQMELVGMYGYYYLLKSKTEQDYKNALMLMNLARSAINNPRLDMQIATAYKNLGDNQSAAVTLNQILASEPDFEPATDMLKNLSL